MERPRGISPQAAVIALAVMILVPCSAAAAGDPEPKTSTLLVELRGKFAERNPGVTEITLLGLAPRAPFIPNSGYVVLAHGIRKDHLFEGSFEDELFAVFLLDGGLTRVTHTLKWIPSPRWADYTFRIERVDLQYKEPQLLVLVGSGATYGDIPQTIEIVLPVLE